MKSPTISIGMPVYNGEKYIHDALDSISCQNFEDIEIIICDNASTDKTEEICRSFAAKDSRIIYHRHAENIGAAKNYNDTFRRSRGRYFKWAAHDDMIAPNFLERCYECLLDDPGVGIAFARMREVDSKGDAIRDYDVPIVWNDETVSRRIESLLCAPPNATYLHRCVPITGLMRSEMLRQTRLIGRFNHSDKVSLVEMALLGRFVEVPEFLFLRRIHAETSLAANPTPQELAAWFDPARRAQVFLPRSRLFREYGRSILRANIPLSQRLACSGPLLRLLRREWRIYGGEFKRAVLGRKTQLSKKVL